MAQNVISLYQNLHKQLTALQEQERELSEKLNALQASASVAASQVQPAFDQRIQAIDDDLRKINIYITGAKDYASLTQYTPIAENVHFATLQQLYTMLSNSHSGRQNALLLLKKAYNAKKYWEDEKRRIWDECKQKSASLINNAKTGPEATRISKSLSVVRKAFADMPTSAEMSLLATEINNRSKNFFIKKNVTYNPSVPQKTEDALCFGFAFFPFPIGKIYSKDLKNTLGSFFSETDQTIMLPLCFPAEKISKNGTYSATKMAITYNDRTLEKSHKIMQGLLFNILRCYVPLRNRVFYLDLETYNPEYLGAMKSFSGTDSLIYFPTNSTSAASALRQLESDALEESESARHRRYLIIRGYYSGGSDGKLGETLKKICNDTRKNNITVIFIDKEPNSKTATYVNNLDVNMRISSKGDYFYTDRWGAEVRFGWLTPPAGITSQAISNYSVAYKPKKIKNEYEGFFKLSAQVPSTRERKPISVPFGITSKGEILNLTLEGTNIAAFVMGGTGSGKSTMLHTIIAGIVRNYHPDEVELWLADFMLTEFAPYVRHMPPHIRYILMDSSKELIYDFVDRLVAELERRKIVLRNHNKKDRRDLPPDVYLPAIVVIIDEFANMSEVIKDNEPCKEKLAKLLREGRKNGFRFIFASQSFTAGAKGLNPEARKNIAQRIAMYNEDKEEIKQTLNIPSGESTPAIAHDINTLPPYHSLHHWTETSGKQHVDKSITLYFEGKDDQGWSSRFAFIDNLRKRMSPVDQSQYNGRIINQYVNKHPVVVSSGSLQVFSSQKLLDSVATYRKSPDNFYMENDMLISFGVPCKLDENQLAIVSTESKEHIFLLGKNQETPCVMSILFSTIRSFIAQKANIQVWANPRNPVYHTYKNTHFSKLTVSEGREQICQAIAGITDNIRAGKRDNTLIVLLGIEGLYADLNQKSENDFFSIAHKAKLPAFGSMSSQAPSSAQPTSEDPLAKKALSEEAIRSREEDKFFEEGYAKGKTDDELEEEFEKYWEEYRHTKLNLTAVRPVAPLSATDQQPLLQSARQSTFIERRDYQKELQKLVELGSQYGCHFLLCTNNYDALKAMGLSVNRFNHRLAFQTDTPETSMSIFGTSVAAKLQTHICYYAAYGSSSGRYNVIPYLHKGVTWDNWVLMPDGTPKNMSQT